MMVTPISSHTCPIASSRLKQRVCSPRGTLNWPRNTSVGPQSGAPAVRSVQIRDDPVSEILCELTPSLTLIG